MNYYSPKDLWIAITGDEADATLQVIKNDAHQHDRSGVRVLMPCKGRGPLAAQPTPADENICFQMQLFGQILTTATTSTQSLIIFSSWPPQSDGGEALQNCLQTIGFVPDFFLSSAPPPPAAETTRCIFFSRENSVMEIMETVQQKLCAQTSPPHRLS